MDERWMRVVGYPDYEISDTGRCRSLISGKVLKPIKRRKYLAYHLVSKRGPRKLLAHRLVLIAFIGPCQKNHETRHLDGVRSNNRLSNLQWGTHSENIEDSKRLGQILRGSKHGMAKLSDADVALIRDIPGPLCKIARESVMKFFGISMPTLYRVRSKTSWKHI